MKRYIKYFLAMVLPVLLLTTDPAYATQPSLIEHRSMAAAPDLSKIVFQEVASGLTDPVFITNAGDGSGRIFVVERAGQIRIIKSGSLLATPFLNIQSIVNSTGGEQGLVALAFHPSYSTNGEFFVVYTAPRAGDSTGSNLVLKKYSVSAGNPDLADPASGVLLLSISHPVNGNHNGGGLAFGQDGYLYWSTGDGGSGGDPPNNAQKLTKLLGKMLRIDVDSGSPYGIPSSNPFYGSPNVNIKKEIWAYGLRNPWHYSFDSLTGDLYIGDVGQSALEEIDFQPAGDAGGENYGWRVMEGDQCYNPPSGCDPSGKTLPVAEYDHTVGCAVTGGYVYRGSIFPSLYGYYFYADYCTGVLFNLYRNSTPGWDPVQSIATPYSISTFGEDEQKELYLADYGTGKIYSIGYQPAPPVTVGLRSVGANDGWVLESSQTSSAGGTLNMSGTSFNLGDDAANKQYRVIVDFDTSTLPDAAIITSATLRIKEVQLVGTNPFTTHGSLKADMRKPYFGSNMGLEIGDFNAGANLSFAATFNPMPIDSWYRAPVNYAGKTRINLTGGTQFRLRFVIGDNNDNGADYIRFFSGNASAVIRPELVVQYYIP